MDTKKFLSAFVILIAFVQMNFPLMAQDKVITKEGDTHEVYNVEISDKYIFYTKDKSADATILRMDKSTILMIKYQDGTKKMFTEEADASPTIDTSSANTKEKSDILEDFSISREENERLKNKYRVDVTYKEDQKSDKKAKSMYCQFDFCDNAVLADKNVEIELKTAKCDIGKNNYINIQWVATNYALQVTIRNKTNKVISVDLGNSFFIRGSEATPYYIPTSTSQTNGTSGGVGVNLGSVANAFGVGGAAGTLAQGVNVGSGNSAYSTTVTYSQRIISVPPMSSKTLEPQLIFIPELKDAYDLKVTACNMSKSYGVCTYIGNLDLMRGDIMEWNETNSPMKIASFISYSLDGTFKDVHTLQTFLYAKKIIPLPRQAGGYAMPTVNIRSLTENFTQSLFFMAEFE